MTQNTKKCSSCYQGFKTDWSVCTEPFLISVHYIQKMGRGDLSACRVLFHFKVIQEEGGGVRWFQGFLQFYEDAGSG